MNIVATYGRSIYSLVIGLFTARWILIALGQVDYGLVGLIGGLTGFVSFLNGMLSSAVGRFYAVSVGAAKKCSNESEGLEECRQWFNVAISVHLIVPIILVAIGYPIGEWCVRNFLVIPADRIDSCVWVWRFTCVTCFVSMVNVPFNAMYTAKQEIAELTVYGFATATANACFFYYMVIHPGDWLCRYSMYTCAIFVLPQLLIAIRAFYKYQECRLRLHYLFNVKKYKLLFYYAAARSWSELAGVVAHVCQPIVVNKYAGAVYNASMSIGASVASHTVTLSSAMSGAFWPAIANKAGEGDLDAVRRLSFAMCRFGALLVLLFALPLAIEIDEVLKVWLVNPPAFAAEICVVHLIRLVFDRMTDGYWMAIFGTGNGVMKYSLMVGWNGIVVVVVSWILFACGFGMWSVCIGLLSGVAVVVGCRLYLGRSLVHFHVGTWLNEVLKPMLLVVLPAGMAGGVVRLLMTPSILRIIASTCAVEAVLGILLWMVVLRQPEKRLMFDYVRRLVGKLSQGTRR